MCSSEKHSIEATPLIITKFSIMDSNVELRINQCQDKDTQQKHLHSGMLRVALWHIFIYFYGEGYFVYA